MRRFTFSPSAAVVGALVGAEDPQLFVHPWFELRHKFRLDALALAQQAHRRQVQITFRSDRRVRTLILTRQ